MYLLHAALFEIFFVPHVFFHPMAGRKWTATGHALRESDIAP
jgi:hypothetical protein